MDNEEAKACYAQRCAACSLKEKLVVQAQEKQDGLSVHEDTVAVSVWDLEELLHDNRHLHAQVTELQRRGTELIQENRELSRRLEKFHLFHSLNSIYGKLGMPLEEKK